MLCEQEVEVQSVKALAEPRELTSTWLLGEVGPCLPANADMLRAFSRSTTTISTVRARSMSHAAAFAYPPARRDAEASEAYKSVKHGEVVVKDRQCLFVCA